MIAPEVQAAMDRAEGGLSHEQREALLDAIVVVAMTKAEFTADDVWKLVDFPETRGLGGLMQKAARAGLCTKAGYVPKRSAQGGRWQFTLWRSEVCERAA